MSTSNGKFDIDHFASTLQEAVSSKTDKTYEYPDEDMLIPVNSETEAINYAYNVNFPDFDNIAPKMHDTVPEIAPGPINYSSSKPEIDFPNIKKVGRLKGINLIAELLKCSDYPFSYLEFWFLDILEECLMYAQDCPEISHDNLDLIVRFLILFLKDVRVQQLDLCGMLTHFKLQLENFEGKLMPNDANESVEKIIEGKSVESANPSDGNSSAEEDKGTSDFSKLNSDIIEENFANSIEVFFILEYIYKAFGNSFIFKTLQIAMLDPPAYVEQDLPYRIEFPKQYLPANLEKPVKKKTEKKGKGKEKKAKEKKAKDKKKGKNKTKGKGKETETSASPILTLNQTEDLDQQALEAEANRQLEFKKYILPLKLSVGPEYYAELFKPPPKPEKGKKDKNAKKAKGMGKGKGKGKGKKY